MATDKLAKTIDDAFEARDKIGPKTKGAVRKAVNDALDLLDAGKARVAERRADGQWQVNQWLKKAVLLSFRLNDMSVIAGGPGKAVWWDKVDSKMKGWTAARFRKSGFRAVPGCVVRRSAYIAPGVVLMPSFVNLGAYVDSGTMVDTRDHRGQLLHRRALGSGRGRDRARGRGAVDGRLSRRLHPHRRPRQRRGDARRSTALFGGRARLAARQKRRTGSLLRGDRQARGRAHAVEDEYQRVVEGLADVPLAAPFAPLIPAQAGIKGCHQHGNSLLLWVPACARTSG
jgi:hypothetical protein